MSRRPRSLRTKLVAAFLSATVLGLVTVMGLTAVGVNAYLRSRLHGQVVTARALLVDYLTKVPNPVGPPLPPQTAERSECASIITDPHGQELLYYGHLPAKLPTPPLDLLRAMADDQRTQNMPGSEFFGGVGKLPNGNYVVVAVSAAYYNQILRWTVLLEGCILLLVLGLFTVALVRLSKKWLQPLWSVADTARHIADGDLSRRVEVSDSTCEVDSLTRSFNTMVARLQESFGKREHAEDRLRQFVAAVGHELRTPLTAISGYAQLARMGGLKDAKEFDDAMRRVHNETERMTGLIDEMLLLAKLDQGRPYEAEPVDLGQLCLDAVHDARAAGPEWTLEHDIGTEPYLVVGDSFRLRQIVTNLLANIRAHTPPGTEARVRLSTSDRFHVIDIVDQGPGIPAGLREQVFERFFRASPTGSHGVGLGLSIVAELVECHGGTITVLPTDRGCWFQIRLPAMAVPPAAQAAVLLT